MNISDVQTGMQVRVIPDRDADPGTGVVTQVQANQYGPYRITVSMMQGQGIVHYGTGEAIQNALLKRRKPAGGKWWIYNGDSQPRAKLRDIKQV